MIDYKSLSISNTQDHKYTKVQTIVDVSGIVCFSALFVALVILAFTY